MKKTFKIIIFLAVIFLVGGIAGVVMDRSFLPWLSEKKAFGRYEFLKKLNERTTIVNRTEQIVVKEDFSVAKTAQGVLPSMVSIVSYEKKTASSDGKISSSAEIKDKIKTGMILTSDGLVVSVEKKQAEAVLPIRTLAAIQEPETLYRILAADGKEFDAKKVAEDDYAGLVYYKIEANNLPAPSLGDSDDLAAGERIVISGNASGEYQNTFTFGIMKEFDRTFSLQNSELSFSEKMEGVILTDAQIDDKNIGGPAIDFSGNVVGIANMIEKDGQKTGFVVPVNSLKESMNRLIKDGKIERAKLGAYYLSINKEVSLIDGLTSDRGSIIYSFSGQKGLAVLKGSAAEKAGITLGDIILAVDGEEINLNNPLSALISKKKPGQQIVLKVLRAGKNLEIKITLD